MENIESFFTEGFFEDSDVAYMTKGQQHYHNNYEIYYLVEGVCHYFVANNSYKINSGDIILIPPGVIHNTTYENIKRSRILLNLPECFIPSSIKEIINNIHYYPKNAVTHTKIKEIIKNIQTEYNNPDNYSENAILYKILELLILLIRNYNYDAQYKTKNSLVEKSVNYIQDNYASNITLSDTAKYCHVSKEHLSRTFKKEVGFSFREFLNIYRLKKADAILKSYPEFKIIDVALCCGYNDSNYFSKLYKQMYKTPPKKFKTRKSNKSDINKNHQ